MSGHECGQWQTIHYDEAMTHCYCHMVHQYLLFIGLLVMCGCALWNKKSYLLSFNEHIIQEIDLNLVY